MQLRLGFLSIFGMAMLLTPVSAIASDNAQPYKATTVDECIQEKECFWHHLLLAVQTQSIKKEASPYITIRKWDHDIRFRRIGFSDILNDKVSTDIVNQALPYFQQKLISSTQYNFLVFVTDNIETAITKKMKENFDTLFGPGVAQSAYKKANEPRCFHLNVLDKNNFSTQAFFAFISRDNPDILSCYKESIYAGMGLSDISFSPIIKSGDNPSQFTQLELILLLYVYQDFVKNGMSYEQLKAVFDKSYEPFLEYLKENNILQ